MNTNRLKVARFLLCLLSAFLVVSTYAQTKKPSVSPKPPAAPQYSIRVTQIDDAKLMQLLEPKDGKPLLVNFWATWCVPCRMEFPDLVKIDADYKGKIDFITVTLDEPKDINTAVPKFLTEMKAEMPAYLLVSENESDLITSVAKDWTGGMPFTILYTPKGDIAYFREGKVKTDILRAELEKLTAPR
jgi:thiol-disulfide isomerase/thioredoxin